MTPPPKKITVASRTQWLRERFETFRIWCPAKYPVPTICVSHNFTMVTKGQVNFATKYPLEVIGEELKCLKY